MRRPGRSIGTACSWPFSLLSSWVALWMVAVPLLHVHPGAAHGEGKARHVHEGLIHTVFSSDLPGEFAAHSHHEDSSARTAAFDRVDHWLNHLEIAFPVLTSTLKKPSGDQPAVGLRPTGQAAPGDPSGSPLASESAFPRHASILTAGLSVRGPPACFI